MQGSRSDSFIKSKKQDRRFDDGTKEKNTRTHGKFNYHKQQRQNQQEKTS
jgi:hypothetical protein